MTRNKHIGDALLLGSSEHYLDAALYDHEYHRRREDVRFYRQMARQHARGKTILELGCGTGRLLVPLLRDGHRVVGVDAMQPMLDRCRDKIGRLPQVARARVTLIAADFRRLNLRQRFALIVCPFNGLMHLYERADIEAALRTVQRLLAPGGRFVFDVMNPDLKWLSRDSERRWARTRFRHPVSGKSQIYSTDLLYDNARQIAFMRIYYETPSGKRLRTIHLTHRYFFPQELAELLHYNGFAIEKASGDFDGSPLGNDSEVQVVQCRVA